jgi:TRAP-type mannitol/chloroaromatic compound transport system substrate-binding protein
VKYYKTPDAILTRQLQIWDDVVAKKGAENPSFKRVLESQRAFAARAAQWQNDTNVNYRMAYNHFFAKKKGA